MGVLRVTDVAEGEQRARRALVLTSAVRVEGQVEFLATRRALVRVRVGVGVGVRIRFRVGVRVRVRASRCSARLG